MHKVKYAGLAYVYALALIWGTHWYLKDELFFHSDPWSLFVYSASVAIPVAILLGALSVPLWFFLAPARRETFHRLLTVGLLGGLLMTFLSLLITMAPPTSLRPWVFVSCALAALAGVHWLNKSKLGTKFIDVPATIGRVARVLTAPLWVYVVPSRKDLLHRLLGGGVLLWFLMVSEIRLLKIVPTWKPIAICALGSLAVIYWLYRPALRGKINLLVTVVGVLGFLGAPFCIGFDHIRQSTTAAPGPARHLVMIVLDGMPPAYIHTYNPSAERTQLDDILSKGQIFYQMRTSRPYTTGFFGTLYSGQRDIEHLGALASSTVLAGNPEAARLSHNLLADLQGHGVSASWMCFHRNGIPEGSLAHISGYNGLRSYLLKWNEAWVPHALGLDYHVAINGYETPNDPNLTYTNSFTELLLPQLRRVTRADRSSFTLFHTGFFCTGKAGWAAFNRGMETAQGAANGKANSKNIWEELRAKDYRYPPELEPLMRQKRRSLQEIIREVGNDFAPFMAQLEHDPALKDVTIMLTADHGSMYENGKLWYGFHPDEHVVRVPFALLNTGTAGKDERLFSTPDITASILDFFHVEPGPRYCGQSIFDPGAHNKFTVSLTCPCDSRKEWFMVINTEDVKYCLNLHREGTGQTSISRVDHFSEKEVGTVAGLPRELVDQFPAILKGFGLTPRVIHERFAY